MSVRALLDRYHVRVYAGHSLRAKNPADVLATFTADRSRVLKPGAEERQELGTLSQELHSPRVCWYAC
jgi:hypothetical protein